jgi:hypothetical protein
MNRWAIVIRPLRGLITVNGATTNCGSTGQMRTNGESMRDRYESPPSPRSGLLKIAQQFIAGLWAENQIRARETGD